MGVVNLTIKSSEIAIVKNTNGEGTHDKGYLFGTGTGTENSTIFTVTNHSNNAGHTITVIFRVTEGSATKEVVLHAGDSLTGPFAEVEIDAISNAAASAIIYYQQH